MGFRKAIVAGAAALAGLLAAGTAQAQNVQVGMLQCDVSGGVGLIIASQKAMVCTFRDVRGSREVYAGAIRKFGLDIGATVGGEDASGRVFAPSARRARRARRRICRRLGRGDRRRRARSERAGRRLGPVDRLAAGIGGRSDGPQRRGRCRRPAVCVAAPTAAHRPMLRAAEVSPAALLFRRDSWAQILVPCRV